MKRFSIMTAVLAVAATAVMGATCATAADTVELRLANVTTQTSKDAAEIFVKVAAEESGGRLIIHHFPDNMLGDDRVATESTMLGDIDMVVTVASVLSAMIPDLYVWDAPFIFNTVDDAFRCIDSELGHAINDQVERKGLKYMGALENGFRHYTNSKTAVKLPADVSGHKVRVLETDVQIALWRAFGANPTPMAFAEVLSGLQQGTIDAQENPLAIIDANKFYEIQHYISLTGHVFTPHYLYMNKARYDSLDPELQQALDKAVAAFQSSQRQFATELNNRAVQTFRDAGCEVIELTDEDKQVWRKAAVDGGVYDLISSKMEHPEYLERILKGEY